MTQIPGHFLIFALTGLALLLAPLLIGALLRPRLPTAEKDSVYECGEPAIGSSYIQFDLRFYVVALLFIVFDVEVVFFYPWAVTFRRLGWFGFAAMMVFVVLLAVALLYEWRKGALEWD